MIVPHLNEVFSEFKRYQDVDGSLASFGKILYTRFVFSFEAAAVLLTAALVGSVMIAKRRPVNTEELE